MYVDTERAGGIVTVKGELVSSAPAHPSEPPPPKDRYPKGESRCMHAGQLTLPLAGPSQSTAAL